MKDDEIIQITWGEWKTVLDILSEVAHQQDLMKHQLPPFPKTEYHDRRVQDSLIGIRAKHVDGEGSNLKGNLSDKKGGRHE